MKGWRIWLGIVVIFLSGIVTGVLGLAAVIHHKLGALHLEGPPAVSRMVLDAIDWKLELDDEQRDSVHSILADTHHQFMEFRAQHQEHIEGIVGRSLDRIWPILNPEQQQAWKELRWAIEEHLRFFDEPRTEPQDGG